MIERAVALATGPMTGTATGRLPHRHDLVVMQLHLAIDHPPQPLHQAARLVLPLAQARDLLPAACPG